MILQLLHCQLGWHYKLNRLAGGKVTLHQLIMLLSEDSFDARQHIDNMKESVTDRRQKARYIRCERALRTAFDKYKENNDVNSLLRFACHREDLQAISDQSDVSSDEEVSDNSCCARYRCSNNNKQVSLSVS